MQAHRITDSESSSSPIPEASKLRTPSVTDSTGGAISEKQARERNRMVKVADQAAELAFGNGYKVSSSISGSLMPTPNTMDHLPARTAEQKAKNKGKGGYSNVRETVVNDLMPTPTAVDGNTVAQSELDADNPKHRLKVAAQVLARDNLMPTPTTRDHKDGSAEHERDGKVQTDTVARAVFNSGEVLLPTTRASMNDATKKELAAGNPKKRLETEVRLGAINWGKFEPAIRRWEQTIGRPAPAPTKADGKDGNHRLSSKFTEWMMGLPDGWLTDVGLKRNDELKACGNGVVPQQAELALRMLLAGHEVELKEDSPR